MNLNPISRARNTGDNNACQTAPVGAVDQRGVARTPGHGDIGAVQATLITDAVHHSTATSAPTTTSHPSTTTSHPPTTTAPTTTRSSGPELANTGTNATGLSALALTLLTIGLGVLTAGRRRNGRRNS